MVVKSTGTRCEFSQELEGSAIAVKMCPLAVVLCFFVALRLEAQNITGRVVDSRTSEELPFANVFLNNTTIGAVTDTNGEFNMTAINATGTYELVFSFVGYKTYKTKVVIVGDGSLKMGTIKLIPAEEQLSAVEVSSTRDKKWERKLKQFEKNFLGNGNLAAGCTIINPWVIDFPPDNRGNRFIAKASVPIEIDNRSLGYKIIFYLSDYWHDGHGYSIIGNARFTELESTDIHEISKWEANRSSSYRHSVCGLFKSIIDHRIDAEGYTLYANSQTATRYDTTDLVVPDTQKDFYKIILRGSVEVHYRKKSLIRTHSDVAGRSWIKLNDGMIIVNKYGFPENPVDVEVSGDMSSVFVAGILPLDYQPQTLSSEQNYYSRESNDSNRPVSVLDSLVKIVDDHSENHRSDKVYVHFDKPYYVLGEESWYKAYVVTESDLNPTKTSSTLYLDWVDPLGKVIRHQRLRVENGSATGDFTIDRALREGTYTVRAYTNWMRNEDPELYYSRRIPVFNPRSTPPVLRKDSTLSKIDLQFFPEGGGLVPDIKTQVAFKAIDVDGMGVEVNGDIVDEQNNPIATFRSIHNGMGLFSLVADSSKSYHAVLKNGQTYSLPRPSGSLALAVSNMNADKIVLRIQSRKGYRSSTAFLIGYSRGSVCYAAVVKLDNTTMDINISKDELPEGVLRLTLFNDELMPQCERMLFIQKNDGMVVTIKSDKEQYAPRDSITLNLEVNDGERDAVQTVLSVSVTDAGFMNSDLNSENIYTRLLLQSDIRGNLENPGWYFSSRTIEKTYALDLVMLTHGWSRYNWEQILNPVVNGVTFPPESGIAVVGQLLSKNKPVANKPFILTTPQLKNNFYNIYETDSTGHFVVSGLDFSDSLMFSWQVLNGKEARAQSMEILLDTAENIPPVTQYAALYETHGKSNDKLSGKLIARFANAEVWHIDKTTMLKEVVVQARRIEVKGVNANTIAVKPDAKDVKSGISTSMFVSRYAMWLPSATLKQMPDGTQVWGYTSTRGFTPFVIVINGLRVETAGAAGNPDLILNTIPIDQIGQVYISNNSNILVSTINAPAQNGFSTVKHKVKGYDVTREFYHPKYEPPDVSTIGIDNRLTLYWNANLQTNAEGRATVKFYNNDTTRKLLIVVEGIAEGHVVSAFEILGKD